MRRFRRWLKCHPLAVAFVLSALAGLALGWDWLAGSGLLVVALAGLGWLFLCVSVCTADATRAVAGD